MRPRLRWPAAGIACLHLNDAVRRGNVRVRDLHLLRTCPVTPPTAPARSCGVGTGAPHAGTPRTRATPTHTYTHTHIYTHTTSHTFLRPMTARLPPCARLRRVHRVSDRTDAQAICCGQCAADVTSSGLSTASAGSPSPAAPMPPPFLQLQLGFGAGLAHELKSLDFACRIGAFLLAESCTREATAGERRHEEG